LIQIRNSGASRLEDKNLMSITVKIQGAPPQDGESLCQTCRYAHIQKGFRESEETVFCGFNDGGLRPIKFKVAACTDYTNRTVPNRWELEQMALLINVPPARKRTGFRIGPGFVQQEEEHEDKSDALTK
jgi:hypothetical protein